ncbi:MAG: helicase-related protein [Dehalococcoidia bacterium]|nr:helicase-related protein [Dehalococcoidia bacterium]
MTDTLSARDFILDFLRSELVGPSQSPADTQPNGEEILRPQDPPRQRYGAGVLFPMKAQVPSQDETAEDEVPELSADSPDHGEILEDVEQGSSRGGDIESIPETEHDVNLANQYLPSAMGLSVLVEVPDVLRVKVSAAKYEQGDTVQLTSVRQGRRNWLRQPIERTIDFATAQLIGIGSVRLEEPVLEIDGQQVLVLHVVSRPYKEAKQRRLITFTLVNRLEAGSAAPRNTECFFQCGFSVTDAENKGCFVSYPEPPRYTADPEELSLQLLHLHRQTYAVGHGCAAEWDEVINGRATRVSTEVLPVYEVKPVLPTEIEGLPLRMTTLASDDNRSVIALCDRLADEYEAWIEAQEDKIAVQPALTPELKATAGRHMENCRNCLDRMRQGIRLLDEDSEVAYAFRLMNEAMLMQQIHYEIASQHPRTWVERSGRLELESEFETPSHDDPERQWRPFQLAFILMNLKSVADPNCDEREIVDVIWFPTGGGKTEAYLGLSAFTMILRRLRNPAHAGTSILMRYTLRLLTTQQFQRAASLICACEVIRRREESVLGPEPFTIGLWVGGEVTPNTEANATQALTQLQRETGDNKFILLSCPWCGAEMGLQKSRRNTRVKGYRIVPRPRRVRHICEDQRCAFSSGEGLPVKIIDEHIYASPPTLLIGTVDKFAMLAFRPQARGIFGIDMANPPPELIIQDELHLISGPLGSMVGHYETAIDALCEDPDVGLRPKVIGSTATISRAESQVRALYGRPVFLFPPQALRTGDSFFAEERQDQEGRRYVGVFASAFPSHVTSQIRTMGALLQAPKLFDAGNTEAIDPYWTMMGYFNSLRELGHAATLIRADITEYLNAMYDRLGLRLAASQNTAVDPRRFINRDVELTSRIPSSRIPSVLQQLFACHTDPSRSDAVDVCFATNMIQVGLDIPRLSLMTIIGQPKTTSEYIQASSRVGRSVQRPGIVVTNYNPSRSRDRSHYEHFRSYHQALYKHVEPTSVTPFAVPVRERALHALIIILCRFWGDRDLRERPNQPPKERLIQKIKETIRKRVMAVDPDEWPNTEIHIDEIFEKWSGAPRSKYGDFRSPTVELPMMYPAGGQTHPHWPETPYPTPSSMRNVDVSCSARPLPSGYGTTAGG